MITRPLELAARLRAEPHSLDWLFFVNGGLIVLFFALFGSKFVLAPALALNVQLPSVVGAEAAALAPTSFISVTDAGQIFADDGLRSIEQLPDWLRNEAKKAKEPVLLIRASREVKVSLLTQIVSAASQAGFARVMSAAVEPKSATGANPRR